MSRKKKIPKMVMFYDLSESETKAIPFRVADYTERRKKKKSSLLKEEEEESGCEFKAKVKKPVKDPDPGMHLMDLLPDQQFAFDDYDLYSSDIEKGLLFTDSQSNDYLFLDNESFYYNQ